LHMFDYSLFSLCATCVCLIEFISIINKSSYGAFLNIFLFYRKFNNFISVVSVYNLSNM